MDHGDFYKAIRHSLSLANEPLDLGFCMTIFVASHFPDFLRLRSSQLGPQSYYKL